MFKGMSVLNKLLLTTSIAGSAILPTNSVLAQDQNANNIESYEEIIVSARRRDESLLDVPVAISAFSGDDLERIAVENIVEIAKFTPNVTLEVTRGSNTTLSAFIRGVGQQDPVAGFEAGVGLYIDDIYLNRPQAAVVDIYDVERVEVLRGPQGTLYGRNTIGGAIKYVTKRLPDEFEVKVRGAVGTYEQLDLVVTAGGPITDTLKIGGSFATLNRDGFGDNLTIDGLDNYNKSVLAGRLSLEFEPNDQLFIRLAGDYIDDSSDPRQGHRLIPSSSGEPVLDDVFDTRAGLNTPEQNVEAYGFSATVEYSINENWTLKNILAYREDESRSPIDFDSLPVADIDVPVDYENDQFSEELQILYEGEDIAGILGFYYLDANALNAFDVILGTTGELINLPGLNAFTLSDVDTSTWAIFGDVSIDLNEKFQLSLGGRYTSDERTSTILRQTLIGGLSERFGGTAVPIATTSDFTGSETFERFTPRGSISWRPNDNHNVYFSYSRGFKGGGFDPRGQSTAAPDFNQDGTVSEDEIFDFLSFEPEEVDTFELGWKAALADGRVNIALTGFLSSYKDIQIPGSVGVDTTGDGVNDTFTGITSNAGDADVNGIEFEGQALVAQNLGQDGDSLAFNWAVGYIDAEFNEFIDAFGNDVADQRVFQNTPEWTVSGNLNYSLPLEISGSDGTLSIINSVAFRSAASQFEVPSPLLDQDAFALWDASIVWTSEDSNFQIGLHGKNLTDKEYIVAGYNFVAPNGAGGFVPTLGTEGTLTGFFGNPLTVTLTAAYKF
jgi:iron complex outermembrane receptor protein